MYLFVSVFPAPDSPDTTTDWLRRSLRIRMYASSAEANTCGALREIDLLRKAGMLASS